MATIMILNANFHALTGRRSDCDGKIKMLKLLCR